MCLLLINGISASSGMLTGLPAFPGGCGCMAAVHDASAAQGLHVSHDTALKSMHVCCIKTWLQHTGRAKQSHLRTRQPRATDEGDVRP